MTLLEAQQAFAHQFARLVLHAEQMGYLVTLGDTHRSPEEQRRLVAMGLSHVANPEAGTHVLRLAGDLNLFRGRVYLRNSEDYRPLGEWWEQQHPLASWGGRFGDGNHFSFAWQGTREATERTTHVPDSNLPRQTVPPPLPEPEPPSVFALASVRVWGGIATAALAVWLFLTDGDPYAIAKSAVAVLGSVMTVWGAFTSTPEPKARLLPKGP